MLKKAPHIISVTALILFICISGLFREDVLAQDNEYIEQSRFDILGRSDQRIVIPFKLVNNLIIIEATINGSVPLNLIVDTGVRTTLITALPKDETLGLTSTREVTISGLGEGEGVEAFYSNGNELQIGRVSGENIDIIFLKEDIFQLSNHMGTYVHGLIGHDLFSNFAVEINYLSKKIFLYDLDEFERKFRKLPNHRWWYKFPIHLEDRKPYIDIGFQHKSGLPYSDLRLIIDTGASNAFSLYNLTHESIKIPESNLKTLIGVGLSGNVNGFLGRVQELKLGDFTFEKPVVAYPDSLAIRQTFALGNRNGSLGGEVLRRFKVIFNYRDEYLLVRKNRNYNDYFHYNISGIEVATPYPNLPLYVISNVREQSLAEKAGLKKGDIILNVNGEPAGNLDLNGILNNLQKDDGSKVRIEIQRDTLYKTFTFELENELYVDP